MGSTLAKLCGSGGGRTRSRGDAKERERETGILPAEFLPEKGKGGRNRKRAPCSEEREKAPVNAALKGVRACCRGDRGLNSRWDDSVRKRSEKSEGEKGGKKKRDDLSPQTYGVKRRRGKKRGNV